ncbi:MAG: hypothetical protein AUJ20_04730 [Comamonadaceae bacterium CG1_02_60_18]|nr:MAG: hypothetical protein AUJ20_04730 [Comamonadaceae bacterium CG1_02_60_18]
MWQLAQLVALVKVLWSALAPFHVLVDLWQLSHAAVVDKWPLFLPVAVLPLWQLEQLLVTETLAWNLAGVQLV